LRQTTNFGRGEHDTQKDILQVRLGQRPGGFLQGRADGGVEAGVREGDLLCQGRGHQAGQGQQGDCQELDGVQGGFEFRRHPGRDAAGIFASADRLRLKPAEPDYYGALAGKGNRKGASTS
jgi:hypothetical protein